MTLPNQERGFPQSAEPPIPETLLDDRIKGIPPGTIVPSLAEVGLRGWNVLQEDLPFPLALLRESALEHNSRWMQRFLSRAGASIAPHGKTTMSPQLFARQIEDGAWGITVATPQQLQVCRQYGFGRLLLANQLVSSISAEYVLRQMREDPHFEFYCFVDSVEGVDLLERAARAENPGRPLQLLLEVGFSGGRTGVRDTTAAREVALAVREASPHLVLRGVSGFEGLIPGTTTEEAAVRVRAYLSSVVEMAELLDREDCFAPGEVILSAGGSAFYDLVIRSFARARLRARPLVLLRSGCYLTHDSLLYAEHFEEARGRSPELDHIGEGLRPALELWAYVQSRPEPTRAILGFGKRDCSYDAGLPRVLSWFRRGGMLSPSPLAGDHRVVELNDQHAFLDVPPDSPLRFGDMVVLGISHPCTTFDKWQLLYLVDDDYGVVGAIRTYF